MPWPRRNQKRNRWGLAGSPPGSRKKLISESDDGSQRLWLRSAGRRYLQQPWPLRWVA